MNRFEEIQRELRASPRKWLLTGCAGFIGSNLLEFLLKLDQAIVGMDNFATGHPRNLEEIRRSVSGDQWARFKFMKADIRDLHACRQAVDGIDYVLHQAALGSVPRSIENPALVNDVNINGFLNMLIASRDAMVTSFVYAGSSSAYGDLPDLPKVEDCTGNPLSPYAVSKYTGELYARVFAHCYGFRTIGLRYFNVFGKRQDPNGAYAAVIPRWITAMLNNEEVIINGNGETSRDFCFIDNVVQANLLAATAREDSKGEIYNVAVSDVTTLNQLFNYLKSILIANNIQMYVSPVYHDFRGGDVMHSQADISKAAKRLGYAPVYHIYQGLEVAMPWYIEHNAGRNREAPRPLAGTDEHPLSQPILKGNISSCRNEASFLLAHYLNETSE